MTIAYRSSCWSLRAIALEKVLLQIFIQGISAFSEQDQLNPHKPCIQRAQPLDTALRLINTYYTYSNSLQHLPHLEAMILTPRTS